MYTQHSGPVLKSRLPGVAGSNHIAWICRHPRLHGRSGGNDAREPQDSHLAALPSIPAPYRSAIRAGALKKLFQKTVHEVKQRQHRMTEQHARPGISHDPLDLLTHLRLEAMDRAPCACRFIHPVRTPADAL